MWLMSAALLKPVGLVRKEWVGMKGPGWLCWWVDGGQVLSVPCPSALSSQPGASLEMGAGIPTVPLWQACVFAHSFSDIGLTATPMAEWLRCVKAWGE